MTVFNLISLLGGLALFLYGMRIMGDGLKSGSSGAFKNAIGRVTNNPFMGFLLGLFVTAIIQSSTATIVLTAGLVGAGVISLHQSLGIILGANVGTTVTGQIIRLLDVDASGTGWLEIFKPSTLAPVAAIIGIIFIMFLKLRNSNIIGTIAMGFGILFTGLLSMTAAVDPLSSSPEFARLFVEFSDKPFLGFLAGTGVAFLLQSSSATVGILQALSVTGQLSLSSVYAIIIGIYMGDCITTAIVCYIGAKANAKRTGIIHILFNICTVIIVVVAMLILTNLTGLLDGIWNTPITSGGIANVNTVFKLGTALLLLPICGTFEKLSKKIVKDDPVNELESQLKKELAVLDRALYGSPELALASARTAISAMAKASCEAVLKSLDTISNFDQSNIDKILDGENSIDTLADQTSDYLLNLNASLEKDKNRNEVINFYIRCISEFERIGDLAVNITENATELHNSGGKFSQSAALEIKVLSEALCEVMVYARDAFANQDIEAARHIEPIEEVVDDMVMMFRENHIERLREGLCDARVGFVFQDILVNAERISDQCSNVGVYTLGENDPDINIRQHDYLNTLHSGADEQFNKEFAEKREHYFSQLYIDN